MRLKVGWIVKVADIGTPAKVMAVKKGCAELLFKFQDTVEICNCPVSIIDSVISRREAA